MKYRASLSVYNYVTGLYKCLAPEFEQQNKQNRSSIELKKEKDHLAIHIIAEDIIALKASINSVLHLLEVFEKTEGICKR